VRSVPLITCPTVFDHFARKRCLSQSMPALQSHVLTLQLYKVDLAKALEHARAVLATKNRDGDMVSQVCFSLCYSFQRLTVDCIPSGSNRRAGDGKARPHSARLVS
jgi:hypothetical protein